MTTRDEIRGWLDTAKKHGATHLMVVTDTYDYSDFPIEVMPGTDPRKAYEDWAGKEMNTITEVYSMALDLDAQLIERRAWHFD